MRRGVKHPTWFGTGLVVAVLTLILISCSGSGDNATDTPTLSPTPAPTSTIAKRLTATEAEAKAELYLRAIPTYYSDGRITDVGRCMQHDYNAVTNEYLVGCQFRFRFDEQPTPRQEPFGPVEVPIEAAGFEAQIAVNAANGNARIVR